MLRPLGSGAMGEVYLAHDQLLDRPVAIKLLRAALGGTARERLLIEARAIARVQHPNVVTLFRVGEVDGRPFLVSEFVRGQGLDQVPLPLSQERLRAIALGLSRGLCAVHRRGVLHRDIKPANAILAEDGEVKLLDFGLAKLPAAAPPVPAARAPAPHPGGYAGGRRGRGGDRRPAGGARGARRRWRGQPGGGARRSACWGSGWRWGLRGRAGGHDPARRPPGHAALPRPRAVARRGGQRGHGPVRAGRALL